MSFRNRLTLFFVVIVVVPMLAVAVILYLLIAASISSQTDASLGASQSAAIGVYQADQNGGRTRSAVAKIARDPSFVFALAHGDIAGAQRRARVLVPRNNLARLAVFDKGRAIVDVGDHDAIAPNFRLIKTVGGRTLGTLEVSRRTAASYARAASRLTAVDIAVESGTTVLAASDKSGASGPGAGLAAALRARGGLRARDREVDLVGGTYRVSTFAPATFDDRPVRIAVLLRSNVGSSISRARFVAGSVLGGFLALALVFALLLSRSLQRRLVSFLDAARRLGAGDFGTRVPVVGHDEFAALGEEFNSMASQLESRLEELRQQRNRLEVAAAAG